MKNRILSVLLAALFLFLLLPASIAGADGASYYDSTYNAYMYSEPHYGIVICTKMNVRDRASTSGKSYCSIRNGQPVRILGVTTDNNFYILDLDSCGKTNNPGGYGYAKRSLIKIDPEFIATTKLTNLYATPWSTELKNGEQNNRFFLIIAESGDWYAVQAAESNPGTAFVRRYEVGTYSTYGYYDKYVVTWDAPAYDISSWATLANVKRFTVGSWQGTSGDYTILLFNEGAANQYTAYIPTQYVAPIRN